MKGIELTENFGICHSAFWPLRLNRSPFEMSSLSTFTSRLKGLASNSALPKPFVPSKSTNIVRSSKTSHVSLARVRPVSISEISKRYYGMHCFNLSVSAIES